MSQERITFHFIKLQIIAKEHLLQFSASLLSTPPIVLYERVTFILRVIHQRLYSIGR